MKIEHLAIWVNDIESCKQFYTRYFKMRSGSKYSNNSKQFNSYFLSFDENYATRIELMQTPGLSGNVNRGRNFGYTHIAISVGSKEDVNMLTETLRNDGYKVISEPRTTGDGYYESVVLDPEGNHIEITE